MLDLNAKRMPQDQESQHGFKSSLYNHAVAAVNAQTAPNRYLLKARLWRGSTNYVGSKVAMTGL